MTQNGITTTDGVYEYFIQNVDAMTLALGYAPIRWEEVRVSGCTFLSSPLHVYLSCESSRIAGVIPARAVCAE